MERYPSLADALADALDDLPPGLVLVAGGEEQAAALTPLAGLELTTALAAIGQPAVDVMALCDMPDFSAALASLKAAAMRAGRPVVIYQPGPPAGALLRCLKGGLVGSIVATRTALAWSVKPHGGLVIEAEGRAFAPAPYTPPKGRPFPKPVTTGLTTMEGVRL